MKNKIFIIIVIAILVTFIWNISNKNIFVSTVDVETIDNTVDVGTTNNCSLAHTSDGKGGCIENNPPYPSGCSLGYISDDKGGCIPDMSNFPTVTDYIDPLNLFNPLYPYIAIPDRYYHNLDVPYDLDCIDIGHKVWIGNDDPHHLDRDGDRWGCESYG